MVQFLRRYTIGIAILFHCIGVIGVLSPFRDQFVLLTPFNLLLTFTLLLVHQKQSVALWSVIIVAGIVGFFAEVVGVETGRIFGEYFYGKALGLKFFDVPLVIGLNWAMLLLMTNAFSGFLGDTFWVKSLVGAVFMTLLDALIEPVAPLLDFWYWTNDTAPLQNFLAWFIIALVMHLFANKILPKQQNPKAIYLYYIHLAFFFILNFTL